MNDFKTIRTSMIAATLCLVSSLQAENAKDEVVSYQGDEFVLDTSSMKQDGKKGKSSQANGIYKGAQVKSLRSQESGKITGTIVVKLKENTSLRVNNAEVLHMVNNYYIVNYNQGINLIEALKKLKQMPQVEEAQIEVQTNPNKAW